MQTPPTDVTSEQVLACARSTWDASLVAVEHLPVGFGAHHWRADGPAGPSLFLTLDPPLPRHTPQSLESAYAAAATLAAAGLEFIYANEPSTSGSFTVPLGSGSLSATRWPPGEQPTDLTAEAVGMVRRLHSAAVPHDIPRWVPGVPTDLDLRLTAWVGQPWTAGSLGEEARMLVRAHMSDVAGWLSAYQRRVAGLDRARSSPRTESPGFTTCGSPTGGSC